MATYTSTQTGLWNDSATWGGGGYPDTADDIANVHHKVEYNITDSSSPFLGDVNIKWSNNNYTGHLAHQTGTYLNLNGRLNLQGGNYEMADDVTLAFTGDNSPDHGVYIYNGDRVSFYANGSSVVNETRMSTSGDVGDYYIPVDDASNFQTGDWISVYFRYFDLKSKEDFFNEVNYPSGVMQGEGVLNTGQYGQAGLLSTHNRLHNAANVDVTEGFVVHDINSNDIYVRDLLGPDSTITAASTSQVTVQNSKVFREGQRIIFSTGSKRTASKITDINYQTHKITLEDNLSSTDVVGESVYLGSLKIHKYKRTVVRTVGNQVTAEAAANATTITLNNVGDYSVGDKFYVEHNVKEEADWDTVMPNNNTSWYQDIQIRHEITGISGNTLTFTPALPYKVYSGAFAYKANRRITIKGASDDPSDGTCKPFFYAADNSTQRSMGGINRYRRKMILKDVQFLGLGNSSGNYQFYIRSGFNDGYFRYSHSPEGLVIDAMGNSNASYVRFDGSFYGRYLNLICCNWYRNFYGGREAFSLLNSVALNGRRSINSLNAGNVGGKLAYLRSTRQYEDLYLYSRSMGQHNNAYQIYAESEYDGQFFQTRNHINQCHFVLRFYPIRSRFHSACKANYIKIDHISSDDHKKRYFAYLDNHRLGYYSITEGMGCLRSFNYEHNNDLYFNGGVITYDNKEGAYLCKYAASAGYQSPIGYQEELTIRPNETVKIKASVKLHEDNPNLNWQYRPYLFFRFGGHQSGYRTNSRGVPFLDTTGAQDPNDDFDFVGDVAKLDENILFPNHNYGYVGSENYDASGTDFRGHASYPERDQFASKTSFVDQTITITNKFPYETTLYFGLFNINNSGAYGWYFKPFVIARNQSESLISKLANKTLQLLPSFMTKGTVASRQKKRFGGARL